jgi:LPS export ABC transporter protein LptC
MRGFLCLVSLFTALLYFSSCQNDAKDIASVSRPKLLPTQQGKGITMIYTDSARLKMILKAPKMQTFDNNVPEPFTVLSEGVMIDFFNQNQKAETTLRANYGVHYPNRKRMEVKYNVVVVNKDGERLNTEHLVWDEAQKKILSDAFVKITTGKEIIMGKGLESNQDFTQYQIKEVTGTIHLSDEMTGEKSKN